MERRNHKQTGRFKSRALFTAVVGLGILTAAIYWMNFKIHDLVPLFAARSGIQVYVAIFLFLSALYLTAVFLVVKMVPIGKQSWRLTGTIIFFAVIF